jgi:hypothetical protein
MANPNPSPDTRFGGKNGNPSGGGKNKGQRKAEMEAAENAAKLRARALSELMERMESKERLDDGDLEMLINPASLKLFKDSEDRAHGTPTQAVEHTSPDGSMSQKPTVIELVARAPNDDSAD